MKLIITVTRVDGGGSPWIFEESRYADIAIAREQMILMCEKFNQWADGTGQVRVKSAVSYVPVAEPAPAVPNDRERQRLAASELATRKGK